MSKDQKDSKVVDFNEKRRESIEKKRRQFERVVFQDFLGVYTVIDDFGSGYAVKLLDVSQDGCQLQVPYSLKGKNQFKAGAEHILKLFFTEGTYLPASVKIRHVSEYTDEKGDHYLRIGGVFDTSLPSYKALSAFIEFIYQYAEFSCRDKGESKIYFL